MIKNIDLNQHNLNNFPFFLISIFNINSFYFLVNNRVKMEDLSKYIVNNKSLSRESFFIYIVSF